MKANKVESFKVDPQVIAVMNARARRARAEFVHNALVRLIRKLTPRLDLRLRRAHWG